MSYCEIQVKIEGLSYRGVVPNGKGAADGFLFLRGSDELPREMIIYELRSIKETLEDIGFPAWIRDFCNESSPYLMASYRSLRYFQGL